MILQSVSPRARLAFYVSVSKSAAKMLLLQVLMLHFHMLGLVAATQAVGPENVSAAAFLPVERKECEHGLHEDIFLLQTARAANGGSFQSDSLYRLQQDQGSSTNESAEADAELGVQKGWGRLSHGYCQWAFHNKHHVFHGLWSTHGFLSHGLSKQRCWQSMGKNLHEYIGAVTRQRVEGYSCLRNWIAPKFEPRVDGSAMILGNDHDIDEYCDCEVGCSCAKMVRLALWGAGMSEWNMCRNLEFLSCGTRGALPGQRGPWIFLATAPSDLWPEKITREAQKAWDSGTEYYVGDYLVTLMEMCLLDMLCLNHDELFKATAGSYYRCEYNEHNDLLLWLSSGAPQSHRKLHD